MRQLSKGNQHLTLFSVYVITLVIDTADKDSFNSVLRRYLSNTEVNYNVLILGDFNAGVSKD